MDEQHGLSVRVAILEPCYRVQVSNWQHAFGNERRLWIKASVVEVKGFLTLRCTGSHCQVSHSSGNRLAEEVWSWERADDTAGKRLAEESIRQSNRIHKEEIGTAHRGRSDKAVTSVARPRKISSARRCPRQRVVVCARCGAYCRVNRVFFVIPFLLSHCMSCHVHVAGLRVVMFQAFNHARGI